METNKNRLEKELTVFTYQIYTSIPKKNPAFLKYPALIWKI